MAVRRKGKPQVIEGSLQQFPFPELVSQLYREGMSGILLANREEEEKKVCFQEGQVVYASSSKKVEKLGYLLVEKGVISREDLLAASKDPRDLRTWLLEEERLTEGGYDEAVASLIVDIVASSFDWATGEFSFVEVESLDIPGQVDNVSMPDIFLEGVRCIEDAGLVESGLGDPKARIAPGADTKVLQEEINLEPAEDLVLAGIDASRPIEDVIASSMMGPKMTRRFLYALVLSGRLEVEGREARGLPRAALRPKLAAKRKKTRRQVRKSVLKKRKRPAVKPKAPAAGPSESAPEPVVRELTLEQKVQQHHSKMAKQNHYELLGIEQGADDEKIRRKYYELAREYHPDTLGPDAEPELRKHIEELFGRFGEAYNVLRDQERREEYNERLAAGEAIIDERVDPHVAAQEAFERGRDIFTVDQAAAAQFFRYATDNHPEKAEYWLHLGKSLAAQSTTRKEAEDALKKALELEPANYRINEQMAYLYKAGGLKSRAIQMAREVLRWDPEHIKMQQFIADLDDDEKKGALGSLFKKK